MYDRLRFDWHTHTVYSHGRGTIEENVQRASAMGLESIAITDHGPGHFGYGFKRRDIPEMREEIERLRKIYHDIRIYMSVEANVINESGELDVEPDEFKLYDFVIAGYHFGVLGKKKADSLILHGRNLWSSRSAHYPDSLIEKNTMLVVNALKKNKIVALTHPGDKGEIDLDAVCKACEDTGTWLEISNRHRQLTVEEIRRAARYDVKFVIGSDAHESVRVGMCENALSRVKKAGLDPGRVVNLI